MQFWIRARGQPLLIETRDGPLAVGTEWLTISTQSGPEFYEEVLCAAEAQPGVIEIRREPEKGGAPGVPGRLKPEPEEIKPTETGHGEDTDA